MKTTTQYSTQHITRGANHPVEGDTTDSLTTRAKVRLSADDWKTIKAAGKRKKRDKEKARISKRSK
jgi:hypothetical protein